MTAQLDPTVTVEPPVRPAFSQSMARLLQAVGVGIVVGFLAGLVVGGVGSRIAMYVSGLLTDPQLCAFLLTGNGFRCGVFTFGGTVALLMTGAFGGMFGGLIYACVRPLVPGRTPGRGGLTFGLVLLAVAGTAVIDANNVDFRRFGPPALNVVMYAVLYPLYGLMFVPMYERMNAALARARIRRWLVSAVGVIGVVFIVLLPVVGIVNLLFDEVSMNSLAFFAVTFTAFVLVPLTRMLAARRDELAAVPTGVAAHPARIASYGAIAVGAAIGTASTLHNIWRIVA